MLRMFQMTNHMIAKSWHYYYIALDFRTQIVRGGTSASNRRPLALSQRVDVLELAELILFAPA